MADTTSSESSTNESLFNLLKQLQKNVVDLQNEVKSLREDKEQKLGVVRELQTQVERLEKKLTDSQSQATTSKLPSSKSENPFEHEIKSVDQDQQIKSEETNTSESQTGQRARLSEGESYETGVKSGKDETWKGVPTKDATAEADITTQLTKLHSKLDLHDTILQEYDYNFQFLENISVDGTLVWKITNINTHMENARSGKILSLFSQPFYTRARGYKMCGRVYPNGDGKGKGSHVSFSFVLMKGTYDDLLEWPLKASIHLGIVSVNSDRQKIIREHFKSDPTSSSFRRPLAEMNTVAGSALFISHQELFTGPYVKDSTIYLTIDVKLE